MPAARAIRSIPGIACAGCARSWTRRGIALNAKSTGYCGSYEAEAGTRFAQRLLERKLEVTAIVFGNDALAIGFMRVAQQRGIRMPQDLSIVGFDNILGGAMVWPGLTTVAQPMRDMGRDACRYLFESAPAPPAERRVPDGAHHAREHGAAAGSAMTQFERSSTFDRGAHGDPENIEASASLRLAVSKWTD